MPLPLTYQTSSNALFIERGDDLGIVMRGCSSDLVAGDAIT
ncbi:hypothetical protein MXAN_7427 [Myxococcus xanthus DK 1622]|uniref:Uncharacterized protein n=1 Tax=Myxococcus xanthus (strain DK1622) TaxID=246197 RepID=Q1CVP0_MYXXD|nr:hypothetical protein MXAN_7427 [Myxococcus xanthus DK 1622]QZZ55020.1 hypothetical protein MyxoNM_38290 [Myxococcus xanthus]SDY16807.1 hypothetical protein SAMN05444383_1222 [Myxococcus xanthus]